MLAESSDSSDDDLINEPRNDIQIVAGGAAHGSWLDWFLNGCASWQPVASTAVSADSDETLNEKRDEDAQILRFRPEIDAALKIISGLPTRISMSSTKRTVRQTGKSKLTATPDLVIVGDLDQEVSTPSRSSVQHSTKEFLALEIAPGRPSPAADGREPLESSKSSKTNQAASSYWFHLSLLNPEIPQSLIDSVVESVLTVLYPLLCDRDRLIWCLDWGVSAFRHCECQYASLRTPLENCLRSEGLNADSSAKIQDSNIKNIIQQTHRLKSFVVLKSINFRAVEEIVGEWEQILESADDVNPYMILLSKPPIACAVFLQPNRACSVFDVGYAQPIRADNKAPKYKLNNVLCHSAWTKKLHLRDPSVASYSTPDGVLAYVTSLMEMVGETKIAFTLLTCRGVYHQEVADLGIPDDNESDGMVSRDSKNNNVVASDQQDILQTLRADFRQIDRYGL